MYEGSSPEKGVELAVVAGAAAVEVGIVAGVAVVEVGIVVGAAAIVVGVVGVGVAHMDGSAPAMDNMSITDAWG